MNNNGLLIAGIVLVIIGITGMVWSINEIRRTRPRRKTTEKYLHPTNKKESN